MRKLNTWYTRPQDSQYDPAVWCDCFRETLALSRKVTGVRCIVCRREAGEEVEGDLTPAEATALRADLDRLKRDLEDAEWEIDDLQSDLSAAESRRDDLEEEVEEIEARLALIAA